MQSSELGDEILSKLTVWLTDIVSQLDSFNQLHLQVMLQGICYCIDLSCTSRKSAFGFL